MQEAVDKKLSFFVETAAANSFGDKCFSIKATIVFTAYPGILSLLSFRTRAHLPRYAASGPGVNSADAFIAMPSKADSRAVISEALAALKKVVTMCTTSRSSMVSTSRTTGSAVEIIAVLISSLHSGVNRLMIAREPPAAR